MQRETVRERQTDREREREVVEALFYQFWLFFPHSKTLIESRPYKFKPDGKNYETTHPVFWFATLPSYTLVQNCAYVHATRCLNVHSNPEAD